jgi:hypothetical protein
MCDQGSAAYRPSVECAHAVPVTAATAREATPPGSEGYPLPVIASVERSQPDLKLALGGGVGVAVAQEGGEGGHFPDVPQDRVAVPGSDVLPVGRVVPTSPCSYGS